MTSLGNLPSEFSSNFGQALAISSRGVIVGGSNGRAFSYWKGTMTDLGVFEKEYEWGVSTAVVIPSGINDAGAIVGTANGFGFLAVIWNGQGWKELGTLPGGYQSEANGINNQGVIVGRSTTVHPDSAIHAFSYSRGRMTDLGTLPGDTESTAQGINDGGTIVGTSSHQAYDETGHGLVNFRQAVLWQKGRMTPLGVLPGETFSDGIAINVEGTVIGTSGHYEWSNFEWDGVPYWYARSISRPFIHKNGQMIDLNTLIPGGFPRSDLIHLSGINNRGDIVGSDWWHGFLLKAH